MSAHKLLGITQSTCPVCRELVPTKLLNINNDLYFEKLCPVHGINKVFVRADVNDYIKTLHYVKPASQPVKSYGNAEMPCPKGCGFCERHEQHLCLPIIEITQNCNLNCPICLVDAGSNEQLSVEEFSNIIDHLIKAEKQIDVLNLSGGEPLIHPDLLAIIDNALNRPEIVRVSISTNGLHLLKKPELLSQLKARDVVISLQFDGFDDDIYQKLRGLPLVKEKQMILDRLISADISTSLTMTAMRDLNEHALHDMINLLFSTDNIISLMIQPMVYEGRARDLAVPEKRLTLPEIIQLLGNTGQVQVDDFTPLPCSHPACFSLAFYLMLDEGGYVSINHLMDVPAWLDIIANQGIFGLDEDSHEQIKKSIYELWSGPAASNPESKKALNAIRELLRHISSIPESGFNPQKVFKVSERKIKSIFIHSFQDVDTFDLSRARRCCNGYPQKDGTVIPVCVHNVLGRNR
ncbi:MAG: radical SAM protein [Proteobacteria bacterium]|nr:radical SAM protein [Pseudomonadota bacterium]